jgi:hypothetical protein
MALRQRCSNVQGEVLNSTTARNRIFSFLAAISQFSGNHNSLISFERPSHSKRQHDSRSDNKERCDLALHCQHQADVAPSGSG